LETSKKLTQPQRRQTSGPGERRPWSHSVRSVRLLKRERTPYSFSMSNSMHESCVHARCAAVYRVPLLTCITSTSRQQVGRTTREIVWIVACEAIDSFPDPCTSAKCSKCDTALFGGSVDSATHSPREQHSPTGDSRAGSRRPLTRRECGRLWHTRTCSMWTGAAARLCLGRAPRPLVCGPSLPAALHGCGPAARPLAAPTRGRRAGRASAARRRLSRGCIRRRARRTGRRRR
jgi:hypothetical protein